MITEKIKCQICGKEFEHLGSHIWHKHKITAREYKLEFGLPFNMSLISEEVKKKKQASFEKNRKKYVNNLIKAGTKYHFKKGRSGHRRISEYERKIFIERMNDINERRVPEKCPVCNIIFDNLDSHLFNKHGLLRINKV